MSDKIIDIAFAFIFGWHLLTRQWPFGNTLQSVMDVIFGISMLLILLKYFILWKRGRNIDVNQGLAANKLRSNSNLTVSSKKKRRCNR
jgi:hypothetical protein